MSDRQNIWKQKTFWLFVIPVLLFIGVGAVYTSYLVPEQSYRELIRSVERERQAKGESDHDVSDSTNASAPKAGALESFEEIDAWEMLGTARPHIHAYSPALEQAIWPFLEENQAGAIRFPSYSDYYEQRSNFWMTENRGVLNKLTPEWEKAFLEERVTLKQAHQLFPTLLTIAMEQGDGKKPRAIIDQYFNYLKDDPQFFGGMHPSASILGILDDEGHQTAQLVYAMHLMDLQGHVGGAAWDYLGEKLESFEYTPVNEEEVAKREAVESLERLITRLDQHPPMMEESPLIHFANGLIPEISQNVMMPLYRQELRSYMGNFLNGKMEAAVENLRDLQTYQRRMLWRGNHFPLKGEMGILLDNPEVSSKQVADLLRARYSVINGKPAFTLYRYSQVVYHTIDSGLTLDVELREWTRQTAPPDVGRYLREEEALICRKINQEGTAKGIVYMLKYHDPQIPPVVSWGLEYHLAAASELEDSLKVLRDSEKITYYYVEYYPARRMLDVLKNEGLL